MILLTDFRLSSFNMKERVRTTDQAKKELVQ